MFKDKRSRYFVFTRVNPRASDYDLLVMTSEAINASLVYKTFRTLTTVRLVGFLILRGPTTVSQDIGRLLPNFLVTWLGEQFDDGYHWLNAHHPTIDGEIHFNQRGHPFGDLKKKLF